MMTQLSGTSFRQYRFGDFVLDTQLRELRAADGTLLALTGKAFDTLCFLIEHRHRIVGKDELLATVWAGRVVEENNLTQAISAIRRALGANAQDHRYLLTVPGRGYRFVADIEEGGPEVSSPLLQAGALAGAAAPARSRRLQAALGVAALLCVLGGVIAWRVLAPPAPRPATATASLAVLPFRPLTPDAQDELLELGMADTLITRISGATSLRVRSLGSSQRFRGAKQDAVDAGRQLGATYVVEGTIQRSGPRVRVGARLLDTRDGATVWSGSFDENITRVFTLQDRIASEMSSALALKPGVVAGRSPCDGANAEAYRAYLTGRYQLDRPSAARMHDALDAFRKAIDLDPTCARAWAGTAYAYRALAMTGDAEPREVFPLAKAAVERALAIDPRLAEAYASQGFIRFWYDWDWAGAEASLRKAISLNPDLSEAHLAYAHLLNNLNRRQEAAAQARLAIAADPLSPLANTLGSHFLAVAGAKAEAARRVQKALELDPGFFTALLVHGQARMAQGDQAGGLADLRRARALCGECSQVLAVLGAACARTGDRAAAAGILAEMERRDREGYVPSTSIAAVRNALGDTDGALDLLEHAYEERDVRMAFLASDVRWDNLRTQPRFQALVRRMGLATAIAARSQKAQVADSDTVRGGP